MDVSPAIRSLRENPIEGETVTLLLETATEGDIERLSEAITDFGTVDRELRFDTLAVTVPHERVGDVCRLPGIETVETANTLAIDPDGAGEDVRPPE